MRWPLRNFYTFNHLVDSYRNTISEWAMGFRYGNFTLKLAREKKSIFSTLGMKKFPYLKHGPFGNLIFLSSIYILYFSFFNLV
jgi:hypothetical protein